MDKERKACNRATCGNKMKCTQMCTDAKRSPPMSSRPGAAAATCAFPNAGNSTQILYVEPNFTETPSEYDVFYDCFSDVEISQPSAVVCSKSGPTAPPPVKDSRMFRDALKQVINTAQTLLVEFEGSGRRERRGCGSRCRCDVRNMRPQSRTVQLEVTAKVAASKSNVSPNIRIDPISFTIPLKLHLQGQGQGQRQGHGQRQHNMPYSESQQSYEVRKQMAVQDHDQMAKMFTSIEPIRTATIMAPRPEGNIPMEGPAPAFDLHAAFMQQMAAMQPSFPSFPFQVPDDFLVQVPTAQVVTSKVQIQVPEAATASTVSKTKGTCGEVCTIEIQQVPLVDTFLTPSLAPVTHGPFLATIATSSMPSIAASKSQPLSETASQGVCVLCGRRGEHSHAQSESIKKPPCGMCSKGKFIPPQPTQPPQPSEFPAVSPLKESCGKCTKTETSLVVLVPPVQQLLEHRFPTDGKPTIDSPVIEKSPSKGACNICSSTAALPLSKPESLTKGSCGTVCAKGSSAPISKESEISQLKDSMQVLKGPCGKCTRKIPPPVPPLPLQEPSLDVKVKGPCGKCSKDSPVPVKKESSQDLMPVVSGPSSVMPTSKPCGTCSKSAVTLTGQIPTQEGGSSVSVEKDKGPCKVCSRGVASAVRPQEAPCGVCSRGVASPGIPQQVPFEGAKVEKASCEICSRGMPAPVRQQQTPVEESKAQTDPCGICSRGQAPPIETEVGPCGTCARSKRPAVGVQMGRSEICSRGAAPPVKVEMGPCGICTKQIAPQTEIEAGPCGICSRGRAAPTVETEVGPCGICTRGAGLSLAAEVGPCGICSRGVAAPSTETERTTDISEAKGPCGICSRGRTAVPTRERGPCGVCSKATTSPQDKKGPCGICTKAPTPPVVSQPKGPCNICKKAPFPEMAEGTLDLCEICHKSRAPREPPKLGPCGTCGKQSSPDAGPFKIQPCGKCGSVGAPCKICSQNATERVRRENVGGTGAPSGMCKVPAAAATSNMNDASATCSLPKPAASNMQSCGTCIRPPQPTSCGTCLLTPPAPIDRTCGTCLLPMLPEVPVEPAKPKYFKALPQHKDIHICSPCRYNPSPLIDAEGNVFCPHNCGCCLCPWRKRATDSQIDQIKHEKIKVCKCRLKGSIFADYTSRAKCSNTSNFDCCPCRERAEAKYLEMTGEEMWSPDDRLGERIRGEPVNLEDVVEYKRGSTT